MKQAILVSDEMVTLIGEGEVPTVAIGEDWVAFAFDAIERSPTLHYCDEGDVAAFPHCPLIFAVSREACRRLFPSRPSGSQSWHLPNALKSLALAIIDCEAVGEARDTLRLARSIELLCQIHAALADKALVPRGGSNCSLSELDVARIASVRQVVDQRWHEKLTIAELARVGGVNRDKLVRGFRDLYGSTIAEILAERRLAEARRMLLATDLPVASVAYRCSYLNNAAFTRAFSRRFGMAPSELRRTGIAA